MDVIVAAAVIDWDVVVAIARQTAKPCIAVEAVAASRIGDKAEESLIAQVVNPRIRCLRSRNNIFFVRIIEITEFHGE
ncbi:hypothetical protein D3C84_1187330 [compost metagenome]